MKTIVRYILKATKWVAITLTSILLLLIVAVNVKQSFDPPEVKAAREAERLQAAAQAQAKAKAEAQAEKVQKEAQAKQFLADLTERVKAEAAYKLAQEYIEARLKAPSTAKFATYAQSEVVVYTNGWKVDSWVDSQNGFGAQIRTRYSCTIKTLSGDNVSIKCAQGGN